MVLKAFFSKTFSVDTFHWPCSPTKSWWWSLFRKQTECEREQEPITPDENHFRGRILLLVSFSFIIPHCILWIISKSCKGNLDFNDNNKKRKIYLFLTTEYWSRHSGRCRRQSFAWEYLTNFLSILVLPDMFWGVVRLKGGLSRAIDYHSC